MGRQEEKGARINGHNGQIPAAERCNLLRWTQSVTSGGNLSHLGALHGRGNLDRCGVDPRTRSLPGDPCDVPDLLRETVVMSFITAVILHCIVAVILLPK